MNKISPIEHIFEQVLPNINKKNKVSKTNFVVPRYSEWRQLVEINFTVGQLKSISRFYKQKISGNKMQLLLRLYNYLKYSYYVIKIQDNWKKYLRREYNRLQGEAYLHRKTVNITDFFSLDKIKTIPYGQFFCFKEKDQLYGFDARSLHNLILKNDEPKNPYTRQPLSATTIHTFKKFILYGKILKEHTITIIDDTTTTPLSIEMRINNKAQNIFYKIDTFGHFTNAQWFLDLSQINVIKLIRELIDIWEYRAQLTPQIRTQICPPHGNPFSGININHLIMQNINVIKMNMLHIFENLISKSHSRENQSLGAYYILSALTLVSPDAAAALPWLYESVHYNT